MRRLARTLAQSLTGTALAVLLLASSVCAQDHAHTSMPATSTRPAAPSGAEVTLSQSTEEGKKQLVATVRLHGKPVENATVQFMVRRTFGQMILGQDQTLDDGTAVVPFPSDLPGGTTGVLQLSAVVTAPLSVAGSRTEASMPGGKVMPAASQEFPRALWAPQAPVELIVVILLLLGGAWGAYLFVVMQLLAIRKGAA